MRNPEELIRESVQPKDFIAVSWNLHKGRTPLGFQAWQAMQRWVQSTHADAYFLQEAMARQHADGDRLLLGMTLQITAATLARLGEAEPAVVLSGAFSANFPADISAVNEDQKMGIGEAQSLARRTLGEAAYSAALIRGAAMDSDEVVGYAQGEFRRLAALSAESGAQAPQAPTGPGAAEPPGMTGLPGQDDLSQHSEFSLFL